MEKSFLSYLPNPNSKSLRLSPVDDDEVINLISKLDTSKSPGPNSVPTHLIKYNSDILVLDQPTRGLDPENQTLFWEKVKTVLKDKTIIYTSYNFDEIQDYSFVWFLHWTYNFTFNYIYYQ